MGAINLFLIDYFKMTDEFARYTLIGFIIVSLIFIILRIVICLSYQTQRSILVLNSKEIKNKSDIKNIKSSLLSKIVNDFKSLGEKAIANINTESIVKKHINNLNLLFLNIKSLSEFIKTFEIGIILIGILLSVVFDYPEVFGVLSIITFIIFKIFSVIFDFDLARDNLAYEISHYVEEEIGKFYIGDYVSQLQMLKVELIVAISSQGNIISEATENLSRNISVSIKESMAEIAENVNLTMESLSSFTEVLDEPIEKWKNAVSKATESQIKLNKTFDEFKNITINFENASHELSNSINSYNIENKKNTEITLNKTDVLIKISDSLLNQYHNIETLSASMETQLKHLEENQNILKISVENYENSIKSITPNIGDALGSIVGHHIEKSYYDLNEDLKGNIRLISTSNSEVLESMEKFLDKMYEQNKNQNQAINLIKEEIENI